MKFAIIFGFLLFIIGGAMVEAGNGQYGSVCSSTADCRE
jgi:hypothetical protein